VYLADRQLWAITRNQYANLERDILLEDLGPDEIRNRFVRYLVGPGTAQWLDELQHDASLADKEFGVFLASARERFREITQIDPRYAIERSARARTLATEMKTALMQRELAHKQFVFQIDLFLKGYKSPTEVEVLNKWVEGFEAYSTSTVETLDSCTKLANELEEFAKS
jgi:hypothetical protein